MRIDLDREDTNLSEHLRFQRAAVHQRQLLVLAIAIGAIALVVLASAVVLLPVFVKRFWSVLLADMGAALLVFTAALYAAHGVSRWRALAFAGLPTAAPAAPQAQKRTGKLRDWAAGQMESAGAAIARLIVADEFLLAAMVLIALRIVWLTWSWDITPLASGNSQYLAVAIVLVGAFGLLVLERHFAAQSAVEWPEASKLAHLARAVIATLLACAICLLFADSERAWPTRLAVLTGLLPALLALEVLLRIIASAFTRRSERIEPQLLTDSFLAQFLRWPPRPLRTLQDELHERLGIDLRQNWAFAFVRRASLPVLASIALIGWLLTGVAELQVDSRGIYERFGRPVEVWGPGLHLGLPWPLARVLRVENGVVHELATSISSDASNDTSPGDGEGPAPASANRLWDVSHVAENAQVISSMADGKQSFQIVNMDVRFVYRIRLSDDGALAAAYRSADIPALIRSTAGRVLVHDFASRTLDGLLGEQRDKLASDVGAAVQSELDRFVSGVEILSTLIESIHPPSGAAAAYHSVQSAQITAQAIVARERGNAASSTNDAQLDASLARDDATAVARENNAAAEAARLGFAAEQQSYRSAGPAFARERYFTQLAAGLASADLLIIDHRIGSGGEPTIDLRSLSGDFP